MKERYAQNIKGQSFKSLPAATGQHQHAVMQCCLDDYADMAKAICQSNISFVQFHDQLDKPFAFCHDLLMQGQQLYMTGSGLMQPDAFFIEDVRQDERLLESPIIVGDVSICFYAGVPLISIDGVFLGMLYVMDKMPRQLDNRQKTALFAVARQLVSQLELCRSNIQLRRENAQAQQLNQNKDKFFSIIAHDLRAPFHGLLGFSEVLASEIEQLDQVGIRDIANYLNGAAKATFDLLENLLQWAMSENGRLRYRPSTIMAHQLLDEVCGIMGSMAKNKGITIHCDAPSDLMIQADHNMMVSVLQNLLSNALKFTHGNKDVYLSVKQLNKEVCFSVRDTGVGMTQEQIAVFFEAKTPQSIKGTEGEKGAGLGMFLCRRFVERHHGRIEIESVLEQGTTFRVILPQKLS